MQSEGVVAGIVQGLCPDLTSKPQWEIATCPQPPSKICSDIPAKFAQRSLLIIIFLISLHLWVMTAEIC